MEDKTAMQILLDWIDYERERLSKTGHPLTTIDIQNKATELLEVEKKNIMDAYEAGWVNRGKWDNTEIEIDSEHYYSTKYKPVK